MKPKSGRRLDATSVVGLLIGVGAVAAAQALDGGEIRSVLHGTAAVIVFGGTLGATLLSFPRRQVFQAFRMLRGVVFEPSDDRNATADAMVRCARLARANGLLALEEQAERQADPLVQKALRLVADGVGSKHVRELVEIHIANDEERDQEPARVFEALGGYAPTFGILGAVLGLIRVMENLGDPARLGAGIATAFVATVYGVGAANLVFLPMAAKLRARAAGRALRGEMVLEAVLAIQEGLSPRLVEEKLETYRQPAGGPVRRVPRAA